MQTKELRRTSHQRLFLRLWSGSGIAQGTVEGSPLLGNALDHGDQKPVLRE